MTDRTISSSVLYYTHIPSQNKDFTSYRIHWEDTHYTTTIIFGARVHAQFIFRDPRYKLASHTHHTYTARYCDCLGCIHAMRQDVKQPKLRCHCKHIDAAMDYCISLLAETVLTSAECKVLDDYNTDLGTQHDDYLRAANLAEEYSHKTSYRDDVVRIRTKYHDLQQRCMKHIEQDPHLYAHVNADNYPYIHKIK